MKSSLELKEFSRSDAFWIANLVAISQKVSQFFLTTELTLDAFGEFVFDEGGFKDMQEASDFVAKVLAIKKDLTVFDIAVLNSAMDKAQVALAPPRVELKLSEQPMAPTIDIDTQEIHDTVNR